jgi:hypothetical protein
MLKTHPLGQKSGPSWGVFHRLFHRLVENFMKLKVTL